MWHFNFIKTFKTQPFDRKKSYDITLDRQEDQQDLFKNIDKKNFKFSMATLIKKCSIIIILK